MTANNPQAFPDLQCNCDLDNWEPEPDTGHSWVCRIHKAIKEREKSK